MSELMIKYVVVIDNSKTWLQMCADIKDCIVKEGQHIERWYYSRHDKGDSLMYQEKKGDRLPFFIKWMGLEPLP